MREIRTDGLEVLGPIREAKNAVASKVNHARLRPAADERRIPMEAVTFLPFRCFGSQTASFARAQVDAMNEALLAFGVKDIAIRWIEDDIKSVAPFECAPVAITNPFLTRDLARPGKTLVVLQAARDPII